MSSSTPPTDPRYDGRWDDRRAPVRPWYRRPAAAASAFVLGLITSSALVWGATDAAFKRTTTNGSNAFTAGTVVINTDLMATAMFTSGDAMLKAGGSSLQKCIQAKYTGTAAANVELYGSSLTDDGLAGGLTLVIEEGSGTAGIGCGGFSTPTQIYSGTLANFFSTKNSYANGVGSFAPTGTANKMYRFTLSIASGVSTSYQGGELDCVFTFEARAGI